MLNDKDQAKRTNLMKLEAMSLFTGIRAHTGSARWWYFNEMRRMGLPVRLDQSLSAYRASLHWDYVMCGIDCQVFVEREALIGNWGEDLWSISISGIEGKLNAQTIQEQLKGLKAEGFELPDGNENLERQMNFSLGLYGACLMHVDVKFPIHQPPLPCAMRVLDVLDAANQNWTKETGIPLEEIIRNRNANLTKDDEEDPDIIMGDWQTWK